MGIDDQIRTIEDRLAAIEKDRTTLLKELKELRAQRDQQAPTLSKFAASWTSFAAVICLSTVR